MGDKRAERSCHCHVCCKSLHERSWHGGHNISKCPQLNIPSGVVPGALYPPPLLSYASDSNFSDFPANSLQAQYSITATCYVSINVECIPPPSLSETLISGMQQPHTSAADTLTLKNMEEEKYTSEARMCVSYYHLFTLNYRLFYLSHFRGMSANIFHSLTQ